MKGGEQTMNTQNYNFPVELQPIYVGNDYRLVEGRKAVVRTDTSKTLGIVSNGYGLVKHEAVIDAFREAGKKFGVEEKIGLTNDGGNLFYEMLFPKVETEVKKGDIVRLRMIIKNSYNGLNSLNIMFGALRLVCLNGMVVGVKVFNFNFRHTKGFDFSEAIDAEYVKESIDGYVNSFSDSMDKVRLLTGKKVDADDTLFDKEETKIRLPQYLLDEAKEEFNKAEDFTAWGYYNSLTYAITHKIKKPNPSIAMLYGTEAWKATQRVM